MRNIFRLVPILMVAVGSIAQGPLPAGDGNTLPANTPLTLQQAEAMAIANNPQISVGQLLAQAQKQAVRVARSAELPNLNGAATGVVADQDTRLSAGSLTSSLLLNHSAAGLQLNQLIYDFGYTHNLVASASLQSKASIAGAQATREEILLATDMAFYKALQAQATLKVAQSTVDARKAVDDQIHALTQSKLKSDLDQSFADVNFSQAKLLMLDAQNNLDAAMAQLDAVLGLDAARTFTLAEDTGPTPDLPASDTALVQAALKQRPDLAAMDLQHQSAVKYSHAQRDQMLPTISAMGVMGATPIGSSNYYNPDHYGAAGINVSVPIFNGFKYAAEASQAKYEAKAADERTRDLRDVIVRDVRTAWLTAKTDHDRMQVTAELLTQANDALRLADTRYKLGLSSIVELSQAQLQQTQAAIEDANAKYQYAADLAAIDFQTGTLR